MTNLRVGLSALAATAAVTVGGVGAAAAATHPAHAHPSHHPVHLSGPCAKEQRQVGKAQDKLDVLKARFAAEQAKVHKDKRLVALTHGSQRARAKKALLFAEIKKHHLAKEKKAQVQRLAHAIARLQKCQAGVTTTPSPTGTPSSTPTGTPSTTPTGTPSTTTAPTTTPTASGSATA